MAVSPQELNVRRAATLLRCQKVREQRRRRDSLQADHASTEAAGAERAARAASEAGRAAGVERLQWAYDDLGGRLARLGSLAALPALRSALAREDEERDAVLAKAEAVATRARKAAVVARDALLVESRATEKRSKLADRSRMLWRRVADAAEEVERDDQVADTWRPA